MNVSNVIVVVVVVAELPSLLPLLLSVGFPLSCCPSLCLSLCSISHSFNIDLSNYHQTHIPTIYFIHVLPLRELANLRADICEKPRFFTATPSAPHPLPFVTISAVVVIIRAQHSDPYVFTHARKQTRAHNYTYAHICIHTYTRTQTPQ